MRRIASTTMALVESDLPGGHSPGYFAVLNEPAADVDARRGATIRRPSTAFPTSSSRTSSRTSGGARRSAGRTITSSGSAKASRSTSPRCTRSSRAAIASFVDMLRQFRRWALAESDQGPVHLGYRLGHIKGDLRVFRALVYNKGAAVLHMLRRLRRRRRRSSPGCGGSTTSSKFQKAGTDDLERAFEAESGRPLDRFFERWIYGTRHPARRAIASTIGDRRGRRSASSSSASTCSTCRSPSRSSTRTAGRATWWCR